MATNAAPGSGTLVPKSDGALVEVLGVDAIVDITVGPGCLCKDANHPLPENAQTATTSKLTTIGDNTTRPTIPHPQIGKRRRCCTASKAGVLLSNAGLEATLAVDRGSGATPFRNAFTISVALENRSIKGKLRAFVTTD
jgi:hypothetical protein